MLSISTLRVWVVLIHNFLSVQVYLGVVELLSRSGCVAAHRGKFRANDSFVGLDADLDFLFLSWDFFGCPKIGAELVALIHKALVFKELHEYQGIDDSAITAMAALQLDSSHFLLEIFLREALDLLASRGIFFTRETAPPATTWLFTVILTATRLLTADVREAVAYLLLLIR